MSVICCLRHDPATLRACSCAFQRKCRLCVYVCVCVCVCVCFFFDTLKRHTNEVVVFTVHKYIPSKYEHVAKPLVSTYWRVLAPARRVQTHKRHTRDRSD